MYWYLCYKDEVDSDVLLCGASFQETTCGLKQNVAQYSSMEIYSFCVTTTCTVYPVSMRDSMQIVKQYKL